MSTAPKLFISYSWTSEDHGRWVIDLATQLREVGVDVILDKWDLREGHDANQFMEQMVSNHNIKKVVMICDRKYAEKANNRAGGVGTEAQIISPEVYAKQDQNKFVAVLSERDPDGKPFLPVYYKSRIYIDLSSEELYARNFEQLLRWIHDKPLYVKPPLGETPAFLADNPKASLGTTVFLQRAVDAIRANRSHRSGACSDYFDRFVAGLEVFRLPQTGDEDFDEQVIKSIEEFTPYRNEAIELFLALSSHGMTPDEERALYRFFEHLFPFMHRPENVTSYRKWDWDNFRFIVHELFLYLLASLLRYERFESAAQLLRQPFYIGRLSGGGDGTVSFSAFRVNMESMEHRNRRLRLRSLSLRADLLNSRASATGIAFDHLMQADFICFLRDCLDMLRQSANQQWRPETLLYLSNNRPFEIFARAQSRRYFDTMKSLFDIEDKREFKPMIQAFQDQKLRVPQWEFESFSPTALMGYEKLATKP